MERWNSLPAIVRQIVLGFGLFVAGAAIAFGYSYRPLHGALSWRVDHLETRLDERNRENFALREELSKLKSDRAKSIDPATLEQVRTELDQTRGALASAEDKVERLEKQRRNANAGADRWRKRYEKLRDDKVRPVLPAAPASTPPTNPSTPSASSPSPLSSTGESATQDFAPPRGPSLELEPAPAPATRMSPPASTDSSESGMLSPAPSSVPSELP